MTADMKPPKPVTLSYEDALKIGAGDILVMNGIARLVISGPRDCPRRKERRKGDYPGHPAVHFTFATHRRSLHGECHRMVPKE